MTASHMVDCPVCGEPVTVGHSPDFGPVAQCLSCQCHDQNHGWFRADPESLAQMRARYQEAARHVPWLRVAGVPPHGGVG